MKVEVIDAMAQAIRKADGNHTAPANVLAERVLADSDFRTQLRDMVLAAVPDITDAAHPDEIEWVAGYRRCRASARARINALFDKENGNG